MERLKRIFTTIMDGKPQGCGTYDMHDEEHGLSSDGMPCSCLPMIINHIEGTPALVVLHRSLPLIYH